MRLEDLDARDVLDHMADIVLLVGFDGKLLDVNAAAVEAYGYPREGLIGKDIRELRGIEDRAPVPIQLATASTAGTYFEAVHRRADGSEFPVEVHSRKLGPEDESTLISVVIDMTRREEMEAVLRASEERYRDLVEQSPDAIIVVSGSGGTFLEANEAACEMIGYPREELVKLSFDDLATWDTQEMRERALADLATGKIVRGEWRFLRKDGSTLSAGVAIRRSPDGVVQIVGRDMTERLQAESDLRELTRSLERRVDERTSELSDTCDKLSAANDAKTRFLRSMSHELRTPLNSIIGFSSLMSDGLAGPLNDEQLRQLGMIRSSGGHLLALINELLDISRIEGGVIELQSQRFAVGVLVSQIVGAMSPLAVGKGVALGALVGDDVGTLCSDRTRIEQILLNLLGNAIKFTDAGRVRLEVRRESDDVVFAVSDTGRGVAPEDIESIFEEFYRVNDPAFAPVQGTGLGLGVARTLAGMLGGTLSVASELGKGSTFTLRLPAVPQTPQPGAE